MFNNEIKERFLNEIDINKYPPRWWERVFEKTEWFEEKYGKDLCSFTTNEIIEFYKFLSLSSLSSLNVYNTNLIKYGDWALINNMIFDGQNHFAELDNELLNTCIDKASIEQSIISYDKLTELTNQFTFQRDKYIIYALFEGIKGKNYEEIINLTASNIDATNHTVILCSGRTILVSDRFISICQLALKEDEYSVYDYKGHEKKYHLISYEDRIYKEFPNSRGIKTSQAVYRNIKRAIGYLGLSKNITANSIMTSGMIYYFNKKAKELEINTIELLNNLEYKNERDIIFDKYNFNNQVKKRFMIQYEGFLN